MRRLTTSGGLSEIGLTHLFEREAPSLKRLARSFRLDDASAEDIVQDAWIASLRRTRSELRMPREWFRSVVRTLALQEWRKRERRLYRERLAASSEAFEDPTLWIDRNALFRSVLDAMAQLEEPVGTVVRLHYLGAQTTRQIAEQLDRPHSTVKKQLARGRERLRRECSSSPC